MTKLTKRVMTRKLTDFKFDFDVAIVELIEQLKAIQKKYPDKGVCLSVEYHNYNCGDPEYFFSYEETETDEELQSRIDYESEKERQYKLEKEREQVRKKDVEEFERLKRKLGRF